MNTERLAYLLNIRQDECFALVEALNGLFTDDQIVAIVTAIIRAKQIK